MKKIISTIIALIMLLALSSCGNTQKANWSEHLEAGQKFLLDGNYEQAIIEFNKVIEIEPRNVDAYLGLADAYVAQGDYEKAIEVLEKGYAETQSLELQSRINELKGIAAAQTEAMTSADPDQLAEDFAWTLENGVLTISGHGRMPDYGYIANAPWYDRREEIKEVVIENGITSIGVDSFYRCDNLASVTMPDGIISIEENAFGCCTSLTSIAIPEGVTSIGDSAFSGCKGLTSITIPDGIKSIAGHVFESCKGLTSIIIPDSVTSIGASAFEGCEGLTDIIIPDGVTSIGDSAFRGCKSLTGITIPNGIKDLAGYVFAECEGLTSIIIPDSVTFIGYRAFWSCNSLTSIIIPISVTSMAADVFTWCDSLRVIYCEAESKPNLWDANWRGNCNAAYGWGYKG